MQVLKEQMLPKEQLLFDQEREDYFEKEPKVWVYLRRSNKRSKKAYLPKIIYLSSLLKAVSQQLGIPKHNLLIFYEGKSFQDQNIEILIDLKEKGIVHVLNKEDIQMEERNVDLAIYSVTNFKLATKEYSIHSKQKICSFLKAVSKEYPQLFEAHNQIYACGRKLSLDHTFQEEKISHNSTIIIILGTSTTNLKEIQNKNSQKTLENSVKNKCPFSFKKKQKCRAQYRISIRFSGTQSIWESDNSSEAHSKEYLKFLRKKKGKEIVQSQIGRKISENTQCQDFASSENLKSFLMATLVKSQILNHGEKELKELQPPEMIEDDFIDEIDQNQEDMEDMEDLDEMEELTLPMNYLREKFTNHFDEDNDENIIMEI